MSEQSHSSSRGARWARFLFSTLPLLGVLSVAVGLGASQAIHNVLLQMGESRWEQYAVLRVDPKAPDCDPAGPKPAEAPAAGDDDDLFGDPETSDAAAEAAVKECRERHEAYAALNARITDDVRTFRDREKAVAHFVEWGINNARFILSLLVLLGALTATFARAHIGLRTAMTVMEDRVSQGVQLLANGLLITSFLVLRKVYVDTGETADAIQLLNLWLGGLGLMSVGNLWHLVRPAPELERSGGTAQGAALSIPLYVTMTLVSIAYFLFKEGGHWPGVAIYLMALLDNSILYIQVALYIWVGMLLKNTQITAIIFDLLRPWKIPPRILAALVVIGAAAPTAFTGASGIFVIATGSIIYAEMVRAGAERQLAFATTAMSGSMGVVLRPCLLVVIVAAMNYKEVTTDDLFHAGRYVFGLSSVILLLTCLALFLRSERKFVRPNVAEAAAGSGRALLKLVPYVLLVGGVWAGYRYGLGTKLDEHSAPAILPVMMLLVVAYDRIQARVSAKRHGREKPPGVLASVTDSTSEAAGHIGALLTLMGLSICVGAVIERSQVMSLFPQQFGSPFAAMALLVLIMVIVGMIMDPYGATILVSQTLAPIAYKNGIAPVHFWMMVLSAFELGYLTPPVALNRILTRQVIGEAEYQRGRVEGGSFWRRHEGTLMPVFVMGLTLLIVAFYPLVG